MDIDPRRPRIPETAWPAPSVRDRPAGSGAAPAGAPPVTVGAMGGDQDLAINQLVAAIRDGASALVTGADGTAELLERAAPLLTAARIRVLVARAPLDLNAFMDQIAPASAETEELGIERAFVALTVPGPDCDRIALLIEDAHTLPQTTLRYVDWAMRSSPNLSIALAGHAGLLTILAPPNIASLRDRLKLHLVVHAEPQSARTLELVSPHAPPLVRDRPRSLAWFWGSCVGVICVGAAALYLRMMPPARPVPEAAGPVVAAVPRAEAPPIAAVPPPPVPPPPAEPAPPPIKEAAALPEAPAAAPVPPLPTAIAPPAAPPAPIAPELARPIEPDMVVVPRGAFMMGSSDDASERPPHVVVVAPFLMSRHAVTVREWTACTEAKACPAVVRGEPDAPATNVSWNDARQYATWLSSVTGRQYRLPAEAEWEYAARAGTGTKYSWGSTMLPGKSACKECGTPSDIHHPPAVEAFAPNAFGLYGMGGGAAEWVEDCWHHDFQGAPQKAPLAWDVTGCGLHVLRGGSWMDGANDQRVSSRESYDATVRYPTHGFRLVQTE